MRLGDLDALRERLLVLRCNITNVQCISDIFDICLTEVSNAPTVEPFEPDYVGAERLKARQRGYEEGYHYGMEIGKTLNPKIKQGKWNYIQSDMCVCPFCGAMPHKLYKNYCAKCGAELKGGAE